MEKSDMFPHQSLIAQEPLATAVLASESSISSTNAENLDLDCFKLRGQRKASLELSKSTQADDSSEVHSSTPIKGKTVSTNKKVVIKNPVIVRSDLVNEWSNFKDTCKRLNRPEKHFRGFLSQELGCEVAQSDFSLLLPLSCSKKTVSSVLYRYISKFVTCRHCKGANTEFVVRGKDWFKACNSCGSEKPLKSK